MRYSKSALSVLAVAGLLTLASCSSDGDETAPTAPQNAVTTTTEAGDTGTTTTPDDETASTTPSDEQPTTSEITVTVDGEDIVFTPDTVECAGEEGNLRKLIGKTNNGSPLIEVTWTKFVMVELAQQSSPYKVELAEGLTFGDLSATLHGVELDGATVNGTLVCTDRHD